MAENCIFCRIIADPNNSTRICDFPNSVAFLNFEQTDFPGYCLLMLKAHYDHAHDVPAALMHSFMDERAQLVAALRTCYPEVTRINYANLGNQVSHVHEHIIPRRAGDHNEGNPPWPLSNSEHLTEAEYRDICSKIRAHIQL